MKVIYKYEITALDPIRSFKWPEGAKVVHVDSQSTGTMQLWVEIDDQHTVRPTNPVVQDRTFVVYGTGHHIGDGDVYVGTVLDEPFVWHLYERMKE